MEMSFVESFKFSILSIEEDGPMELLKIVGNVAMAARMRRSFPHISIEPSIFDRAGSGSARA
jgi:hypothetical protein